MPAIKFPELANRFIGALEMAGATVLVTSGLTRRPVSLTAVMEAVPYRLEAHLWTITPGGKGRGRPNERRIQKTATDRFVLKPDTRIVVGGWSDEAGVFAFWDVRRHLAGSDKSPSMQISLGTLERAAVVGMATEVRDAREGQEIAVAVHPDYIMWYLREYERLYDCGGEVRDAATLVEGKPEDDQVFVDSGPNVPAQSRREKVVSVVRHFREARFCPMVLRAYGYRCCLSGVALRLVDAAHIVPVFDPTSTDEPRNGLALNPFLHRAYDRGLLGLLPGGKTAINSRLLIRLKQSKLDGGLETLKSMVPARMSMPTSAEFRPPDDYLIRGLKARGWTDAEIRHAS